MGTPQWIGEVAGYAKKFAAANHWKVRHDFPDLDDLVQECAWMFARCVRHFRPLAQGSDADNRALFMAFYKRCLDRYLVRLQRVDYRHRLATRAATLQPRLPETFVEFPEGPLNAALASASRELRQVLHAIDTAPPGLLGLLLHDFLPNDPQYCRVVSRSWCRLARAGTVRNDLVGELRGILQ